jgi:hypothetical protein
MAFIKWWLFGGGEEKLQACRKKGDCSIFTEFFS